MCGFFRCSLLLAVVIFGAPEDPWTDPGEYEIKRGRFYWKTRCEDRDFAYYIGTIIPVPGKSYMNTHTWKEIPALMEKYIQYAYTVNDEGYLPTTQPGVPRGEEEDNDPAPDGYELLEGPDGMPWEDYYQKYIEWFSRKTGMSPKDWYMAVYHEFDLTYYNCRGMDPELRLPVLRGPAEFLLFFPHQWVGGTHDLYTCPPDATLVGDWGPKSGGWQIASRRTHGVNIPVTTKILPTTEWNNTVIVPYTAMRVNKWRRPCTSDLPPTYSDKMWPYHDTPVSKIPVKNWDLCGYARGYCECRDMPKENDCRWCQTFWGVPICAREDRLQPALDQCDLYWEGHVIGGDDIRNMTTGEIMPHIGDDGIIGNGLDRVIEYPPGKPKWDTSELNAWTDHVKAKEAQAEAETETDNPDQFKQRIKEVNRKYGNEQDVDRATVYDKTNPFVRREQLVDQAWEKRVQESIHPLNLTGLSKSEANYLRWSKECVPP